MFKRNTLTIVALITLAGTVSAADTVEVELIDGRTLTGILRTVTDGLYLLQADDTLYELGGREIRAVDGEVGAPTSDDAGGLAVHTSYQRLQPNGDLEIWFSMSTTNRGKALHTSIRWGAQERELDAFRSMIALDAFGNRLDSRIEPRVGTDLYNVIVDLEVPMMPGESSDIMIRTVRKDYAHFDDGVWTYINMGNYAEDRLQDVKVRLPEGAEVLTVSPMVRVVEHDGGSLVFWRRYYPANTEFPLTVTYKLGD